MTCNQIKLLQSLHSLYEKRLVGKLRTDLIKSELLYLPIHKVFLEQHHRPLKKNRAGRSKHAQDMDSHWQRYRHDL